jgi:hypothetical protein
MAAGSEPPTPLEWVHYQIARQPVAPTLAVTHTDRRAVPEPVSAIIMRLLAKNTEDRYQTAAGLVADIRECLVRWERHGRIDSFPPGRGRFVGSVADTGETVRQRAGG